MTPFAQLLGSQSPAAPKTASELEALEERRDELREQLESLGHRRSQLAEQVRELGSSPELRAGPLARLNETDARIRQLERDVATSDELIAAAKAKGLANEDHPTSGGINIPSIPEIPVIHFPGMDQPRSWQDRAVDSLATTVPITLASVLLLGAFLYWRISRSMKQQFAQLIATQSGRLDELQRSVDTVAVEVERVSENQRFVTKMVGDKAAH